MSIIARFCFDVPFGKKADLLRLMAKWEPMSKELGFPKPQVLIGSIGAPESRVELNHTFESLSALEAVWAKLVPWKGEFLQISLVLFVPGCVAPRLNTSSIRPRRALPGTKMPQRHLQAFTFPGD